ncbi:unnamed protein product [Caenorhabditis sp. 36 PRJEB53466]|nr:unnamed protein product [Caenorhabditis sp. 36 PRJEB53466]
MTVKTYLITDCYCVFIAILTIVGNSLTLYLFSTGRLDSRRNLRIILYMAMSDIGFASIILPQVVYMIMYWEPFNVDYDAILMAATGWPLPMFLKICLGLNVGAASERILALYFPITYRKVDHVNCSNWLMSLSILFGSFDTFLAVFSFRFEPRLNCSSIGCFVHSYFRTYWGASNMAFGIVIVVMSVFVFFKVQTLGRHTVLLGTTPAERKSTLSTTQKFRQANRTTCGVLVSCLFCLTIPSLLVSFIETLTGFSVFEKIGAFYIASLLTSGFMNCLIFLVLNGSVKSKIDARSLSDTIVTTVLNSRSKHTTFVDLS